jgi:hypothetical protein
LAFALGSQPLIPNSQFEVIHGRLMGEAWQDQHHDLNHHPHRFRLSGDRSINEHNNRTCHTLSESVHSLGNHRASSTLVINVILAQSGRYASNMKFMDCRPESLVTLPILKGKNLVCPGYFTTGWYAVYKVFMVKQPYPRDGWTPKACNGGASDLHSRRDGLPRERVA